MKMATTAKKKRKVVGSFYKSKEADRPPYLKMKESVTLAKDSVVRVESKKFQLESLERAVSSGKLSGELVEKIRDRIDAIPDFVLGELIVLE